MNQRAVWGSRIYKKDQASVKYDAAHIEVPETVTGDFKLPSEGLFGSSISWKSDSSLVSFEKVNNAATPVTSGALKYTKANVQRGTSDVSVEIEAEVSKGNTLTTSKFNITIKKDALEIDKVSRRT